jgi:ABC-type uncharacterized transport system auxiliary subunit
MRPHVFLNFISKANMVGRTPRSAAGAQAGRAVTCLTAIACLLSASCVSTRPSHYYTLAPDTAATTPEAPDGPTILVGIIATTESLQDERIRYRADHEVGSYEYHRWTERPGNMVHEALIRALRGSGKYRRVMEASSSAVGDYLVHGKLRDFAEVDHPAIETRISLHLELIDKKTGQTVWDRVFEHTEPANGKNIKDVVDSMDRNLQATVADAATGIGNFLASRR